MPDYLSTDPNAGVEQQAQYLSTDPNAGLEKEPSVLQKVGGAISHVVSGLIPKSIAPDPTALLPLPISQAYQGVQLGQEIAGAAKEPLGSQSQYNALADVASTILPFALPYVPKIGELGGIPKLRETAFGKPESPAPVAETAAKEVIDRATQERQVTEGRQPEHPGDVERRVPTKTGDSGGVVTETPQQAVVQDISQPKPEGGVSVEEVQKASQEQRQAEGVQGEHLKEPTAAAAPTTAAAPPPHLAEPIPPETAEDFGNALKTPPRSAGIANRVLEERAARGEIPPVPGGQGFLSKDLVAMARDDYTKNPQEALNAAERFKQGSREPKDMGLVRLHEEALSKVQADAETALDADPKNPQLIQDFNTARDNLNKWHTETVQPMKTQWSNEGRTMQGVTNIDTGTFTGLQKLAWDIGKRNFTDKEVPIFKEMANRVAKSTNGEREAIQKTETEVQRVLKPSRIMDINELRESLWDKVKAITCK